MPTEEQIQGTNQGEGVPVPKPTPAAPVSSSSIPAPASGHVVIRPLRTYKDDLAEAIKKGNLSKESIARAERDKRAQKQVPQPVKKSVVPPPAPKTPTPPKPIHEIPKAPVAPTKPVAPIAPVVPHVQTTPEKPAAPVPPPPAAHTTEHPREDHESKERFFEKLLHVRHEERTKASSATPPAHTQEPKKPVAPQTLLPDARESRPDHELPRPHMPSPVVPPAPLPKPVEHHAAPKPVVPPPAPRPERTHAAKDVAPFLPFWATPDGEAPVVKNRPEPEPVVARPAPAPSAPLVRREDGPTRGSAVEETSSFPVRTIAFTLGGLILVAGLGFGAYTLLQREPDPTQLIAKEFPTHMVTVTSVVSIDATSLEGAELANAFYTEVTKTSSGKATGIIFVKTVGGQSVPLTSKEWFAQARLTPPGALLRSLEPTFAAGSYESHNGGNAFLVLDVFSRDRALSGLLAWEKTMAGDLRAFLSTAALPGASFTDGTLGNVAVRRAGAGESALVYGMLPDGRIVITRGEGTFTGLLESLPLN